jgi:hypothetical protein
VGKRTGPRSSHRWLLIRNAWTWCFTQGAQLWIKCCITYKHKNLHVITWQGAVNLHKSCLGAPCQIFVIYDVKFLYRLLCYAYLNTIISITGEKIKYVDKQGATHVTFILSTIITQFLNCKMVKTKFTTHCHCINKVERLGLDAHNYRTWHQKVLNKYIIPAARTTPQDWGFSFNPIYK